MFFLGPMNIINNSYRLRIMLIAMSPKFIDTIKKYPKNFRAFRAIREAFQHFYHNLKHQLG